jgi:N-acyl-phosphatidylethanolamine-hydrolysing phospholipase D
MHADSLPRLTITGKLKMPKPDPSKPETLGVSVVTPNLPSADATRTPLSKLRATWLGHACYFVEFPSGLRVLFDPVFESRCGPHGILGPPRYTPPACSLADLPPVDAVIISHSHYDHLSLDSVKTLAARNPQVQFFVGLGLAKWFRSSGIERVTEMDWWQDAELTLTKKEEGREAKAEEGNQGQQSTTSPDVSNPASTTPNSITARITCLPCQHASGRTGFDFDTTLWASWSVQSGDKSVWFAGDTGYRLHTADSAEEAHKDDNKPDVVITHCPQFKQIGELRGPFDLGLIPIGAYRPRYLFSWMHADPYDAVDIFRDTRCRRALGMHWGTWVLTYEEVDEPPRLLKKALKERGLEEEGVFEVCGIGETREF